MHYGSCLKSKSRDACLLCYVSLPCQIFGFTRLRPIILLFGFNESRAGGRHRTTDGEFGEAPRTKRCHVLNLLQDARSQQNVRVARQGILLIQSRLTIRVR
jgi:hypothetical protein